MKQKLNGKIALVTGGNSGIGFATAKELLAEGAERVIITGRDGEALRRATAELGHRASFVVADVSRQSDLATLASEVRALVPSLDVVFVNAGVSAFAPVEALTEELFDAVMDTNFKGAVFTAHALLPLVRSGGSIIFCSSAGAHRPVPGVGASVYVASKAALSSFAKALASEVVARGVRVNVVSPGFTSTPLFDKVGLAPEQKEAAGRLFASKTLMQRFARPEEIARAVVFLASDDASYITASDLLVDGGYMMA